VDAKDIRQRFELLAETSLLPDRERRPIQRQAARWASPEALAALQSEVDLARDEYRLGHYHKSEQMLQKLVTKLEPWCQYIQHTKKGKEAAQWLKSLYCMHQSRLCWAKRTMS
jgi:hypothetical protein